MRPRVVLAGLLLAVYYNDRATVADAWRILHYSLRPRARGWLGIPDLPPRDPWARIASSKRLYRGLDTITAALDPARHDRRSRLPLRLADFHAAIWDSPEGQQAAARLQALTNRLVLTSVRMAHQRGYLRGWNGDVGVDATDITVNTHPHSPRRGTASTDITAGWHFKGGTGDKVFGYSATLAIAAHHRDADNNPPKAYPQLCLGFELDTPTVRTGPNAVTVLTQLTELGLPTGILAADRAHTGCSPPTFQTPVRRLGYRLALDYKVKERGLQGSWQAAPLVDGSLLCPLTPAPSSTPPPAPTTTPSAHPATSSARRSRPAAPFTSSSSRARTPAARSVSSAPPAAPARRSTAHATTSCIPAPPPKCRPE
ncbi:hypothetical protein AB0I52_09995 [Streptomyces sp. NPDC050423]|uniref:hypothetical protein n=1 Tax=Streptomyces sp. NPDC050423 TaxID=3155402 RepID=UPI003426977F